MSRGNSKRRRAPEKPGDPGFLVVDKPRGWTSHDVVDAARGWLGTRRVGHLGTLDPAATGVLPLAVRDATKLVPFLQAGRKRYVGTIRLGVETDTQDSDGRVTRTHDGPLPDEASLREVLLEFVGEILQVPPMYSAVKHSGVPLYRMARRGEQIERPPRKVQVFELILRDYAAPVADIDVTCAPGTYVRTLAADIGERLGCGAHLASLRRVYNEPFEIAQARSVEQLEAEAERGAIESHLIPAAEALGFPTVRLARNDAARLAHGAPVAAPGLRFHVGTRLSALGPDGALIAVVETRPDRSLQPLRVLRPLAARE
jgi:tRNA pseudouridine55 synthase